MVRVKNDPIKVGARGSALSLAQTGLVLRHLEKLNPGRRFIIVPIKTEGDRMKTVAALRKGGKGLFVKEIERALLARKVSMAVHSMKDLPSTLPRGLVLGAVPERASPADVFISRDGTPIEKLPPGAAIATSSLRRQAILRAMFPHLAFAEIKGNLDTRLKKLRAPRSPLAGIIVAAAGLRRLYGKKAPKTQELPPDVVVPAAGQGVLALEIRADDAPMKKVLASIHHAATATCVAAERELQRRLEGGCQVPLGIHGRLKGGRLTLMACLARPDGTGLIRESLVGPARDPKGLARKLEKVLVSRGARRILAELNRPH